MISAIKCLVSLFERLTVALTHAVRELSKTEPLLGPPTSSLFLAKDRSVATIKVIKELRVKK